MKRAITFIREQRTIVEQWVKLDEDYLGVVRAQGRDDEGVVRRMHDRKSLLDELDDALETLKEK